MVKTICQFKDAEGPVAIRTDRIVSIEGETNDDGSKGTMITVDLVDDESNFVTYGVLNSVMDCISEWERQLRAQNS